MRRSASISAPCAAVLLAGTGLGGCVSTSTYGTGEAPEMAIFRELTGGLAGKKQQAPIEYQPRAPLVMPPATDAAALPPPVETASVASAAWPIDPDQTPAPPKEPWDDNPADDISPEYAARLKPLAGMGNPEYESSYGSDLVTDAAYDIIIDKNGRDTFSAALKDAKGVGRTDRRYLTDPPEPYRAPAATAPTEFEDIDETGGGNWLTRLLTGG
ncbi:MAG TPA: hypothetical protein VN240_04310 [Propylenella sp.]|nr:hypothetical protein [Propylenella sp.]